MAFCILLVSVLGVFAVEKKKAEASKITVEQIILGAIRLIDEKPKDFKIKFSLGAPEAYN
jgi:hypothetical protein